MMKRTLLGLLIAAGFLFPSMLRGLTAAHAYPSPESGPCGMTNVNVTVTPGEHHYDFDYGCFYDAQGNLDSNGSFRIIEHFTGEFDLDTNESYTHFTDSRGYDLTEFWICPTDPWVAESVPVCTAVGTEPTADPSGTYRTLDAGDRHVLNAQLQNAIKEAQGPAAAPQLNTQAGPLTTSPTCIACGHTRAAPTLPDFAITRITADQQPDLGFTSTYDVVLANLGAKSPTEVQVEIQVTGSLQYRGMVQTPAGFTCSGEGPVICVGPLGGYGDPAITTSATFQLQVYDASPGLGAISADADPNNLIQESDKTNNAETLPVTVK